MSQWRQTENGIGDPLCDLWKRNLKAYWTEKSSAEQYPLLWSLKTTWFCWPLMWSCQSLSIDLLNPAKEISPTLMQKLKSVNSPVQYYFQGLSSHPQPLFKYSSQIQTGSLLRTEVITKPSSFTGSSHCIHRGSSHGWRSSKIGYFKHEILRAAIPRFPHLGICENL